jgi:glycosyltransferase involved in cell wall biosynthesis
MVTTFYPPYNFGGDGIYIHRLSNELGRLGHRVEVVHCVDAYRTLSANAVDGAAYPNHPNVTVHRLKSRAGVLSPLITQQTGHPGLKARRLREILDGGRFDVINFHNVSLIGPRALAYGSGIKIYTMHEHWLVCPMHVLWKFGREACTRKQCVPCTIHGRRPPQLWRYTGLLESSLEHIDAFIAMSRFSRDKHREMGLDVKAPIVHIPYFVPYPESGPPQPGGPTPPPAEPPGTRPYFLFVGRLEKMKGVQVLLDAFREYGRCDLLIAGDGTYEPHLRRLAEGLANVRFLGRRSYEELQALFRNAIALLVSSIGYETFGIVILEAFAQRTPVIVHDLGSLPEIVRDGGGGLIYRDEAGLREALEVLRASPERRRELGERGHDAFVRLWTPEPHLRQYFGLIERIAADKGRVAADRGMAPGEAGREPRARRVEAS